MHEAAFAKAALPAPAVILGLPMRPYSIGHELWLTRQKNPLAGQGDCSRAQLEEAALVCSESWAGAREMNRDWLMIPKIKLWKWRMRKESTARAVELFRNYRAEGSITFPNESPNRGGQASRIPGAPFLLRLIRFLMDQNRLKESECLDYPLGLAHMHYCAYWESQGALEVYNEHDATRDAWIAEMEAKRMAEEGAKPCPV